MGWSCGKMGDEKLAESRYPESGGELEVRKKTNIAMGNCIKSDLERMVGEEWKNDRYKELETADRERSKRKVRGRKKTMEKEIITSLTTMMPRK